MKNDLNFLLNQLQKSETKFKDIQRQLSERNEENFLMEGNSERMMTFWFKTILAVLLASLTIFFIDFNGTKIWSLKNEIEVQNIIPNIEREEYFARDKIEINEDENFLPSLETESPFSRHDKIDEIDDGNIISLEISEHSDGRDHISTNDGFLKDRMRLEYMQKMRVGQFYHRAYCG